MLFDIDFDFFVKETKPHDFGYIEQPFFMNDVWNIRFANLYSFSLDDLTKEIILDKEGLEKIISFVENCDIKDWRISESHLYAYRYIEDLIIEHNDDIDKILDILKIVHIDKHSDLDILDGKIHAGNWLRYIIKNYIDDPEVYGCRRAQRAAQTDTRTGAGSREARVCDGIVYWINQNNNKYFKGRHSEYDTKEIRRLVIIKDINFIEKLDPLKIHNLFLCRSSAWVPPWLDKSYFRLQRKFERLFGRPGIYNPIPKSRKWNYNQMLDTAKKERKIISQIISQDRKKYMKIEI